MLLDHVTGASEGLSSQCLIVPLADHTAPQPGAGRVASYPACTAAAAPPSPPRGGVQRQHVIVRRDAQVSIAGPGHSAAGPWSCSHATSGRWRPRPPSVAVEALDQTQEGSPPPASMPRHLWRGSSFCAAVRAPDVHLWDLGIRQRCDGGREGGIIVWTADYPSRGSVAAHECMLMLRDWIRLRRS